jgi:hypothetical protein
MAQPQHTKLDPLQLRRIVDALDTIAVGLKNINKSIDKLAFETELMNQRVKTSEVIMNSEEQDGSS